MGRKPKPKAPEYAVVKAETVQELDAIALAVKGEAAVGGGPFSQCLGLAGAVQCLRDALTPEVMRPIMALQGTPLGFRTDKDLEKNPATRKYEKGKGYPEAIVKDVVIEACRRGANLVGNEVNIIAARCYLTKEFFERRLDELLGRENWRLTHGLPRLADGGAVVETVVEWHTNGEDHTKELRLAIKGDGYSTADAYLGKADRKAGAWLYKQISGESVPEGDAIDVTAKPVAEPYRFQGAQAATEPEPTPETPEAPPEEAPEPETPVDPEARAIPGVEETPDKAPEAPAETEAEAPPRLSSHDLRKAFKEVLDIAGANRVNSYLVQIGWIALDQSFRDVTEEQMRRIVGGKDAFLTKCLGEEKL